MELVPFILGWFLGTILGCLLVIVLVKKGYF